MVVPKTFTEFTSRRVLTTSWLEGEKLSGSTASDVGDLVNLGVICYLKQLLDTGFFHVGHPSSAFCWLHAFWEQFYGFRTVSYAKSVLITAYMVVTISLHVTSA